MMKMQSAIIILSVITLSLVHVSIQAKSPRAIVSVSNNNKQFSRIQGRHPLLVPNKKADCSEKRFKKLDNYVSKIMTIGKYGRNFPSNPAEVQTYCQLVYF